MILSEPRWGSSGMSGASEQNRSSALFLQFWSYNSYSELGSGKCNTPQREVFLCLFCPSGDLEIRNLPVFPVPDSLPAPNS